LARFYWGIREDVNFLLSEGHRLPNRYPLARVWAEARTARRRIVNRIETDAAIMHAIVGTVLGGKKGAAHFKATMKKLRDGDGGA
jgi:hypothetical protein